MIHNPQDLVVLHSGGLHAVVVNRGSALSLFSHQWSFLAQQWCLCLVAHRLVPLRVKPGGPVGVAVGVATAGP